jgi:hypothetical protein
MTNSHKYEIVQIIEFWFADMAVVRNGQPILVPNDKTWDVLANRIIHFSENGDMVAARKAFPRPIPVPITKESLSA